MQAWRKFKEVIRKRRKIIQIKRKRDSRFMYHNKDSEREEEKPVKRKKRCEFKISIYQLI